MSEQLDRIEASLETLATKVDLARSVDGLATKDDVKDLRNHMLILHEVVRADIKALGEAEAPTRREMREGFDELKELLERRIDPLALAVKHHTNELKKRQRR